MKQTKTVEMNDGSIKTFTDEEYADWLCQKGRETLQQLYNEGQIGLKQFMEGAIELEINVFPAIKEEFGK